LHSTTPQVVQYVVELHVAMSLMNPQIWFSYEPMYTEQFPGQFG
jgi:hypothetical protein